MKTKKEKWSADEVVSQLAAKHFSAPAHGLLREVRNGTGYGSRQERYADALAVSLWPTRGIWFAGVEVKVSRGDWLRELKDPAKSEAIQKWCNYWWIAAPEGIVLDGEVPETWGLLEVGRGKVTVRKPAPRLEAEPPTQAFVAAILRRQADCMDGLRSRVRAELVSEMQCEPTLDEAALKQALEQEKRYHQQTRQQLNELTEQVKNFAADTGVDIANRYQREISKTFALAERLLGSGYSDNMGRLAGELKRLAEAITDAQTEALLPPKSMTEAVE